MSANAAFLQAILSNPDDDAPRLVYADWLEEQGELERAEFIRVQCRLAQLEEISAERIDLEEREQELLRRNESKWQQEVPAALRQTVQSLHFRRGFLGSIRTTVGGWRAHGRALLAVAPICEAFLDDQFTEPLELWRRLPQVEFLRKVLFFTFNSERVSAFLRDNDLTRLRSLDLTYLQASPAVMEAITARGAFPGLETLVWQSRERTAEALALLADVPTLSSLRELSLRGTVFDEDSWRRFTTGSLLPQLTRLDLSCTTMTNERIKTLLESPRLGNLRLLHLESFDLTNDAAQRIADCEGLAELRSLDLSMNKVRQRGIAALAGSAYLANLRQLLLNGVKLEEKSVRQLAMSPHLIRLVSLGLDRTGLTDVGLTALADSPGLSELRRLSLEGNPKITSSGLRALLGSGRLMNLRGLLLSGTAVDAEGVHGLVDAPHLPRLRCLSLPACALTETGVMALTESALSRRLHTLQVRDRDTPTPVQARLRAHFGSALRMVPW